MIIQKIRRSNIAALMITTCLAGMMIPNFAVAQSDTTENKVSVRSDEIVVRARKRDESALRAPVVVSGVSKRAIEDRGLISIDDIARVVPQLVIGGATSISGGAISLRGITSGEQNQFNDQAVSFNIDGALIARASIQRVAVMDLQQVLVYKGPQALFFGKNSYAGVVDIQTADPTDVFEVGASIGYEIEGNEIRGEGFVSGPLTDTLGVRLAVYGSSLDGYFINTAPEDPLIGPSDRDVPNHRELAARLTLKFEPNDRFDAKLKFSVQDFEGSGTASTNQLINCPMGVSQVGGTVDGVGHPCVADGTIERADLGPNFSLLDSDFEDVPYFEQQQILGTVSANYVVSDNVSLTSVSSIFNSESTFNDNVNNSTAAPWVVASFQDLNVFEFSQELRLQTDLNGPLNISVGGYYQYADMDRAFKVGLNAAAPFRLFDNAAAQTGNAYSVFAQALFDVTDTVEIAAGGRYSYEKKEFNVENLGAPIATAVPEADFDNFSPEATVTWRPNNSLTIFGSYKEGFLSGGFNAGSGNLADDRSYGEQSIKGWETGLKTLIADDTVAFNLAAYSYDLEGLQVLTQVGLLQFITNAGAASVWGVDADFNWLSPVSGLTVLGAIGYNNAKYDDFVTTCYGGQTVALGCNLLPNGAGVFQAQDLTGQPLQRAPKLNLDGGFTYEQSLNTRFTMGLNGNASYSSSYFASPTNQPRGLQENYWVFDAGVRVRDEETGIQFEFLGRNLGNERYFARAGDAIATGGGTGTTAGNLSDVNAVVSRGRELWFRVSFRR